MQKAIAISFGDGRYSAARAMTESLEPRQMLSAVSVRKSLGKLDSNLSSAYTEYQQFNAAQTAAAKIGAVTKPASAFIPSNTILHTQNGDVLLQAYPNPGSGKALAASLKRLNALDVTINGNEIDSLFPISQLGKLQKQQGLRFAEPTAYSVNSGAVTSQGDAAVIGPSARSLYNVNGAGIKVGVLSDSFNNATNTTDHYANDVATGDLPANVQILSDNTPGTDEGRAIAQVIYDTAPGASLAFATGGTSYATGASNVKALASVGAKVIVDDLTYQNEPFFADGSMAQAVASVITSGVNYISAAGNYGENSLASNWSSGATYAAGSFSNASGATPFYGGTSFNFGVVNGTTNDRQAFTLANGGNIKISFQWDQPYFSVSGGLGARNQVDAYVLNDAGVIVGGSSNLTIGADPIQLFQFTNKTGSAGNYQLMLVSEAGTALPGYIKYIDFSGQATNWAFNTNSSTVFGHTNATGVESVGAASYLTTPVYAGAGSTPQLESYSSEGGTPILFNTAGARLSAAVTRQAPSIVGPDNVFTTFYGSVQGNNAYPTFAGTSASAASVAGVVALISQKNPSLTPAQMDGVLANTALRMQTPVPNFLTGYGFVQAIPALVQVIGNATGTVFADYNANGLQDPGEPGIGAVTVYLDANNNGAFDLGEPNTATNSAGVWTLFNQPSGTRVIRAMAPTGYVAITTGRTITIAGANTTSGVNFALFPDAYTSNADGSNYILQLDAAKPANFDILLNNVLTYTAPVSLVPALSFSFNGTNSSLTVNFNSSTSSPVPAGGVSASYIGSANISSGLVIINGTGGIDTGDVNLQSTTFDNSIILLSDISSEIINGNNGNDIFSVSAGQPSYESLTFNGGIGNTSLTVNGALPNNGTTTFFNAGTNTNDQNTLTVNAGTFTFLTDPAAASANLTVNLGTTTATVVNEDGSTTTGSVFGTVVFNGGAAGSGINQRNIAALNIGYGDTVIVPPPPSHNDREVLVTGLLSISSGGLDINGASVPGGVLDLNANDMIITSGSASAIQALLLNGYNNGNWNGSAGIQSSAAANDSTHLTALGLIKNGVDFNFAKFDNVGSIASAVLIKYTYIGDADFSGIVDGSDYSRIDNGYLQSLTGWANGDFNYDGIVNGSDYTLLDNAFNTQGPSLP